MLFPQNVSPFTACNLVGVGFQLASCCIMAGFNVGVRREPRLNYSAVPTPGQVKKNAVTFHHKSDNQYLEYHSRPTEFQTFKDLEIPSEII